MGIFDGFKSAVKKITSEVARLESELEDALRQREDLLTSRLPRDEIADSLCDWVDGNRKRGLQALDKCLSITAASPMGFINRNLEGQELHILTANTAWGGESLTQTATLAILGDAVKAGIRKAVDDIDLGDRPVGPPMPERKRRIAALDEKIESLSKELADLRDTARESGLSVARTGAEPSLNGEGLTLAEREKRAKDHRTVREVVREGGAKQRITTSINEAGDVTYSSTKISLQDSGRAAEAAREHDEARK